MTPKRLSLLVLLLALPLALAHEPAGTPKDYCEPAPEHDVHDYAPTGGALWGFTDGNVAGDCDGDGAILDADGHSEWAAGGAFLLAEDGDGREGGALACFGETAHHPAYPEVTVESVVLGAGVSFTVVADAGALPGAGGCGDGIVEPCGPVAAGCNPLDAAITCVSSCVVPFPPGADGSYHVLVSPEGGPGHVIAKGGTGSSQIWTYLGCTGGMGTDEYFDIYVHDPWWGKPHVHYFPRDEPCPPALDPGTLSSLCLAEDPCATVWALCSAQQLCQEREERDALGDNL